MEKRDFTFLDSYYKSKGKSFSEDFYREAAKFADEYKRKQALENSEKITLNKREWKW